MSKPADNRTLPIKESNLFKQVVKHYEGKAYKKGLKAADAVLKRFPEHGETLAMKGLLLNCMERKEEAYELVKRGVKNDLRSHVCWHVYGLLYRSDREYNEAIRCYKQALRLDGDNLTVLRDLALLQVQMRDLPGFIETRTTMLNGKPGNRQNWLCLAVAHHLAGHCEVAAGVLESYEGTLTADDIGSERYEHSEVLLYKAEVLEEGGMAERALASLDTAESRGYIRDRIGALEVRGRLLRALGRHAEARALYRRLLRVNPEHHGYHAALRAVLLEEKKEESAGGEQGGQSAALSVPQRIRLVGTYAELQREQPHGSAARRIPLDFLEGQAFEEAADLYVRRYILKGIPSLFSDLRPLYKDPAKVEALGSLFARFEASLEGTGRLPPAPAGPFARDGDAAATEHVAEAHALSPQALVWVRLYLAQHADALGNTAGALRALGQCAEHTPTLVELHSVRARVLRHAGDAAGAAAAADEARRLDLADRYLNCRAVKELFRAGEVRRAETTAALFTKGEGGAGAGPDAPPPADPSPALFEMQAAWYEIAGGRAYLARGELGKALKRFLRVDAHFADFVEDQFDFHQYCMRKQTLRAYVAMLRMEDGLYRHATYSAAMKGAVQAYLQLADAADARATVARAAADEAAGLSQEDARRLRQKQRKEEQRRAKAEAEAAAKAAADTAAAGKKVPEKGADPKKKDLDPDGTLLAAVEDPLKEATRIVARLCEAAADRLDTHWLAFEVYLRKGRHLLALRAVKHAQRVAGVDDPLAHSMLVRLGLAAQRVQQPAAATTANGTGGEADAAAAEAAAAAAAAQAALVQGLLGEQLAFLLGSGGSISSSDVAHYHESWAARHGGASLRHAAASAELGAELRPEGGREAAVQALLAADVEGAPHAACVEVHALLAGKLGDAAAADTWRTKCAASFRWSRYFGGADMAPLPEAGLAEGLAEGLAKVAL